MENKKYELVKDSPMKIIIGNSQTTVYRVRALKDFGDVKKGDLGGYIQSEYNLSQYGNCWIYDEAICWQSGKILNNSKLKDFAEIFGCGKIKDNAIVGGRCIVKDSSVISGFVILSDNITTLGTSRVYGYGPVDGNHTFNHNTCIRDGIIQSD